MPIPAHVFISYAGQDRERVLPIADKLLESGIAVWIDRNSIAGGTRWAAEIVSGIEGSDVVVLMCSDAAMRSWAVKQEIQIAGERQKILLPLILERTSFPAQMEFFLAGWQWIEVLDRPDELWLPAVLHALDATLKVSNASPRSALHSDRFDHDHGKWTFEGLLSIARFTDQIWPIPAPVPTSDSLPSSVRGLGAPQAAAQHRFHVGDRIRLVIEVNDTSHLLLLDRGPEGHTYCLCPSHFAQNSLLVSGPNVLPQPQSAYESFIITGYPGRENLLAILSQDPLDVAWSPTDPRTPARIIEDTDIQELMTRLRQISANKWVGLATCFDIIA